MAAQCEANAMLPAEAAAQPALFISEDAPVSPLWARYADKLIELIAAAPVLA